ncbi:hypothetical protein BPAE_0005g01100 [Botrytis paeoniae]|uniref:Uncharacterized protein n=1 Tax=Botrytis paeoniae TaxID=278948 RepID=A0A4Z1G0E8_9HELO|nr:hypothetical protein BPAE_0005g01100 [Botrytis paeoniae]
MADGPPPPPPPPHGTPPKSSGLPPGNYDIFIIPPHASGSGFLYLPSLQPNVNSFVAGFASALVLVALTFILKPLMDTMKGGGGPVTLILMVAIGLGAWALGRMQSNGETRPGPSQGSGAPPHGGSYSGANNNTYSNGSASSGGPRSSGTGFSPGSTSEGAGGPPPNPQAGSGARKRSSEGWEETPPPSPDAGPEMPGATPRYSPGTAPGANDDTRSKENASRTAWEEARERTRRKEEERKKVEAEKKRKEDLEKRLRELRAKEALERAAREKKQRAEREARERKEREEREAKEQKEREEREAKERRDREELEAREKRERAAREKERGERERLAKLEREDQQARERKAKEEREIRERIKAETERIKAEAEAKARADYDRRLREEIARREALRKEEEARREVLRKEEEAIKKEQEKLRLEAIARVEADKKARADKEKADAEAKAKAEKARAAAKAWADAKAAAAAKREAKAKEEREKEVAAQIREVKLKEEREKAAEVAAQMRELKLKEERERAAEVAAQLRELKLKEDRERAAEVEAQIREVKLQEERERAALAALAAERRKPNTYSNAGVGERISPWPNGKPPTTTSAPPTASSIPRPQAQSTSSKKPPVSTARTYAGTDKDAQSHSSYAQTPRPARKKSLSSLYSESSYAASQSTSRTSPPPSTRGAYSTKDPDKIVIKGVFAFNNAFHKTPTSQLLSGVGSVTDGLILRITTEGLFIDDDVRGVAQREWDVKAWTMKLVEVWCPSFRQASRVPPATTAHKNPVRRLWGLDKELAASEEEKDTLLVSMLQLCRDNCRARAISNSSTAHSASGSVYSASSYASSDTRSSVSSDYADSIGSSNSPYGEKSKRTTNHNAQTGESKTAGLHILRASIRDQEGKKYVFVVQESEAWKVALGLQRLRRGTQVRSLGVSGMSPNDAKATLENLGWF